MTREQTISRKPVGLKKWLPVGAIALVAIVAGIISTTWPGGGSAVPAAAPAPPAKAKGDLAYDAPAWPEPPDTGKMLVRLGISTLFVLVLCVGTLWVGKRWLNTPPLQKTAHSDLSIAGTLFLGRKCCLYLVNVGNRQVLAGVDGSGLSTLVALPELFDKTLDEMQTREPPPARLAEAPAASTERNILPVSWQNLYTDSR